MAALARGADPGVPTELPWVACVVRADGTVAAAAAMTCRVGFIWAMEPGKEGAGLVLGAALGPLLAARSRPPELDEDFVRAGLALDTASSPATPFGSPPGLARLIGAERVPLAADQGWAHDGAVRGESFASPTGELADLVALLGAGGVVVLTGAGISTDSGIPDYRGSGGALRRGHVPMTYQLFVRDPQARRRYWARSYMGWPAMAAARPNAAHNAVAALEDAGLVDGVITQNVDGLHTAAGSRAVVELHGRLDRIRCLGCADVLDRSAVHEALRLANPGWSAEAVAVNPDGDTGIDEAALAGFQLVDCPLCGGVLKPDVVYFGESVPRQRVAEATAMVERGRVLVVLGSSLTVYSGRRFVVAAANAGRPVAIVNQGATRGDDRATLRIDAPLAPTMRAVVAELLPGRGC